MNAIHRFRLPLGLIAAAVLSGGALASSHDTQDHAAHHPETSTAAPAAQTAPEKGCPMMSGGMKHDMHGGMGMQGMHEGMPMHQMMQMRIDALEKRVDMLHTMLQMQMKGGMHSR